MSTLDPRSVAWWPVHQFLVAAMTEVESVPAAGTQAWCALADDDPRKMLSLAVEGEHVILHREMRQEAMADASKAIAAAADWAAAATELAQLDAARKAGVRIERKYVA